MDGLILLRRAREAGLAVKTDGDKLVIRGPRRAEAVACLLIENKLEVLAALTPAWLAGNGCADGFQQDDRSDPAWWCRRYEIRTSQWRLSGTREKDEAERLAYGELLDEWRQSQGQRWPAWQCAGCDEPMGGRPTLMLSGEYRVHFDEERECLIRFGLRWRSEAVAALKAVGLDPPLGFELL